VRLARSAKECEEVVVGRERKREREREREREMKCEKEVGRKTSKF
jgi:hypothetical protein